MKNLFVLVFVGLCSQGFCMDRESIPSNRGNSVNISHDTSVVLANKILSYFANHDCDEQVADPRQAITAVMPALRAAVDFDLDCVHGTGYYNYHNPENLAMLLAVLVQDGNTDKDELIEYMIRTSRGIDNYITAINADIAAMSVERQKIAYWVYYAHMCNIFKVLNTLVSNAEGREEDNVLGRAVHRMTELLRQMSEMTIRIGRYVQDRPQS